MPAFAFLAAGLSVLAGLGLHLALDRHPLPVVRLDALTLGMGLALILSVVGFGLMLLGR